MDKPESSHNQVMTIKEVSQYLRIPVSTIYDLTRKGKLRGGKFGKHWRFLKEDIESFLHGDQGVSRVCVQSSEHRQYPRINTRIVSTVVAGLAEKNASFSGTIRNLSLSGAYFVMKSSGGMPGTLESGDPVEVLFELPGAVPRRIEAEGRIVHQKRNGQIGSGIKFKHLSAEATEALQDYVG